MTDPTSFKMPQPGDRIAGKYRVERTIGSGGMGCVLEAEHEILHARVAIKLLLPQAANIPGASERFLREAKAAAALRSEHVTRVMDVGTTEAGAPFLVMEHLTGQDLRKIARERGALPVDEAIEYLLQACEAILEAHASGILHRDLKPANIFVTSRPDGRPLVKVLDFGLAKVLDPARMDAPEESITQTGLVVGSPHYMSPEQFRSLRKADVRSDIWALGVIAYELLAGRRPFYGEGMSGVMMSVVNDDPEPLGVIRPELPAPLVDLVTRCLEKKPERRPAWVAELVAVLRSLSGRATGGHTSENTGRGGADRALDGGRSHAGAEPPATASGTNKAVSVAPGEAWGDVVLARQAALDGKRRRRWLLTAGAAFAVGVAVIGVRLLVLRAPDSGGAAAETLPPSPAPPPSLSSYSDPPPPSLSGRTDSSSVPAPVGSGSSSAPAAEASAQGASPAEPPGAAPTAPRPEAPRAPVSTVKPKAWTAPSPRPGADDPFGKYD